MDVRPTGLLMDGSGTDQEDEEWFLGKCMLEQRECVKLRKEVEE